MERKSALLLAKTGYIIRDVLLGRFTDELVKHLDLFVAVPDPDDQNLKQIAAAKSIGLIPFYHQNRPETNYDKFLSTQHWMYRFKQVERDNPSLEIVTRLYEPNLSGKKKQLVKFLLFAGRISNKLRLMGLSENLFLSTVRRWDVTKTWIDSLRRINPSIVISTALTLPEGMFSPSVDLPPLIAARELSIPSGTLIQSWDNLSSKTYVLPPWLDRYWTWSEAMTEDLIRFNPRIKREQIKVVGSPHFDFHLDIKLAIPRHSFVKKLGLDPARPYVLIGTGTKKLLPDEPITVISLVKRLQETNPELQILLRVHPKDDEARWPGHFEDLRSMGVVIQKPIPSVPMDSGGFMPPQEFFREQVNTIKHAAIVVNTASSLTVDAAILNRPIISLGYDAEPDERFPEGRAWFYNNSEHFGSLVETGGVWVVKSEDECLEAINAYLNNPNLHSRGRRSIIEKAGGCVDGMAGVRLAEDVKRLLSCATKNATLDPTFFAIGESPEANI